MILIWLFIIVIGATPFSIHAKVYSILRWFNGMNHEGKREHENDYKYTYDCGGVTLKSSVMLSGAA